MIRSITVQHFKSLADVTLTVSPVTVLVGPNGSGKSNIIDVLSFLRDVFVYGLDHAISDRGGIDVVRQFSRTRPYHIYIRCDFTQTTGPEKSKITYDGHFEVRISSQRGNFRVEHEEAKWHGREISLTDEGTIIDQWLACEIRRDSRGQFELLRRTSPGSEEEISEKPIKQFVEPQELACTSAYIGFLSKELIEVFSSMHFSHIYPNILRKPSRPDTEKQLREDCSNWASVIKSLRQNRRGEYALHRIYELMHPILPGLEHVTVRSVGGYFVPQFLIRDKDGAKGHYFDPIQLSDGTLRMFALFLTMYRTPSSDLLAIEEPEQTIHPGLLELLVDAFREISRTTQLVVTTHSPHILDYFQPEEIRVVQLSGGETTVGPVRESQKQVIKEGLMSASEVMALDGLKAE